MWIASVKKLPPYDRLKYWIQERESIRKKRALKLPPPWTDDEILSRYRFTNVRRMDDRVSKWLFDNWYLPHKDHKNMMVAVVLARHFNNPDALAAIGFPRKWEPEKFARILNGRRERGEGNFNHAYIIRASGDYPSKPDMVIHQTAQQFVDNPPALDTSSLQRSVATILSYRNFGEFMAGQVVADLRHAMTGTWADKHSWAISGPGSKRGMNRLKGRDKDANLKEGVFLDELIGLMKHLRRDLPQDITKRMEAIDFQSCLCEADKYERTLWGEGSPKGRYTPR